MYDECHTFKGIHMRAKYVDIGGANRGLNVFCPGCHDIHTVILDGSYGWGFNHNLERPTITPSILIRTGHFTRTPEIPGECYCDFSARYPDEEPMPWTCRRCHSFVTDGKIIYLNDCSHALKGQTIDLPDIVNWPKGAIE